MYLTYGQILDMGSAITNDPDGIDSEHIAGVFNVGYMLFLQKFDKIHPQKRLKNLNVTKSDELGTRIDNLVQENGEDFNEFFQPYDVIEVDDDGVKISDVDEVGSIYDTDKGYYTNLNRIYFPNYELGSKFVVRYLPEPTLIENTTAEDTQIFMPRKYAPLFAQYLASMQDSIEEESNRLNQAPLIFDQYFKDMAKIYNWKKPQVIKPKSSNPYIV